MKVGIIASAYGYKPDQVKPWVESLKKTQFDGKVFVLVYNPEDQELLNYFKDNGIFTFVAQVSTDTNMATQRFIDYAKLLQTEYTKDLDAVITTDIRDLIFQKDPSVWLKNNIQDYDLIASGEGITFRHEDWNGENLQHHFNEQRFINLADKETLCSGVIAGKKDMMIKLFETIYDISFFSADPSAFVDQIFYNIAIYEIFREKTKIVSGDLDWAANLGTLKAIPANSPYWSTSPRSQQYSFERNRTNKTFEEVMLCKVPEMKDDGLIYAENGKPYAIVHQYDRHAPWKERILGKEKDVTIVTALYDLGRDEWQGFNRNFDDYKNWMKSLLTVNKPMVIFVDPANASFVNENRQHKSHLTKIIELPFSEFKTVKKWGSKIKEVMGTEEFLKDQTVPTHPQICQPDYNILMHEKMQFVKEAAEQNFFNTTHFMWLDAGIFRLTSRVSLMENGFSVNIKFLNDKVQLVALEMPKEEDLDLYKFFKGHNVRVVGGGWLGSKESILSFEKEYDKLLEETLSNNLIDQDQSYLSIVSLKNPNLCDIHLGVWSDTINIWN
jgi:protein YibB